MKILLSPHPKIQLGQHKMIFQFICRKEYYCGIKFHTIICSNRSFGSSALFYKHCNSESKLTWIQFTVKWPLQATNDPERNRESTFNFDIWFRKALFDLHAPSFIRQRLSKWLNKPKENSFRHWKWFWVTLKVRGTRFVISDQK